MSLASMEKHLFNLKFAAKDLERCSKKCDKEEKAEKLKLKKAIEKGNHEVDLSELKQFIISQFDLCCAFKVRCIHANQNLCAFVFLCVLWIYFSNCARVLSSLCGYVYELLVVLRLTSGFFVEL